MLNLNLDRARSHAHSKVTNRRRFMAGVGATLALGASWSSRPAWAHQSAVPASQFATGNDLPLGMAYVGETSDPTTMIAIVIPNDSPGEAVAFLCDGQDLGLWFTGRSRAGMFTLTVPVPSRLATAPAGTLADAAEPTMTGQFDLYGLTGEITLQERLLTFRTGGPAAGIAGLYVANRDGSGAVRGHGSTGATLSGQQSVAASGEAPYRITGTIVLADGAHHQVVIPAWNDDVATMRWIILPGGDIRGVRSQPGRADDGLSDNRVV